MSDQNKNINKQEEQQNQQGQQQQQQSQEQFEDPDALTQQDQQNYKKIKASLDLMNNKIARAKNLQHHKNDPKTSAQHGKQIAQKLITSKENSQIITKESLLTDINQSYEKVVVDVYSQNQILRKKIKEMEKTIKQQNQKINQHIEKQEQMRKQNYKLREEIRQLKDQKIMNNRGYADHNTHSNALKTSPKNKQRENKQKSQYKQDQNQDYDFWSMPQNQSYISRKKDYVSDSGLWANNQKDIGDSMFVTQQQSTKKR